MKIGTILLLALMILGSGFAHLHAELPSRCKAEDGNATKEEKKEKEVEKKNEKEKPKTVEAQKKHIRIELSLKGYFEDPDAVSISIPTKNWAELKVTEPPVQGKRVKKAISCCGLNSKKSSNGLTCLLPTCRCSIWTGRFFPLSSSLPKLWPRWRRRNSTGWKNMSDRTSNASIKSTCPTRKRPPP